MTKMDARLADAIAHYQGGALPHHAGPHALLRSKAGQLNRLRRLDLPGPGKIAQVLGPPAPDRPSL